MRVFVDANILIAVLNKEYPLYSCAARVLSLHGRNSVKIYTSPLCLAIAFYFAGKKSGNALAKKKIALLCENIEITTVDREIARQAVNNPRIHDFEDGMEYYSALHHHCDYIITENREDFYFSETEVMKSGERIPRRLCRGVSEQDTKKVLDGFGFLVGSAARSFNCETFLEKYFNNSLA